MTLATPRTAPSVPRTLVGKCALVTGGAHGIGRGIVEALAEAGAHVAFTFNNSVDDAAQLQRQLAAQDLSATRIHCDVTEERSITVAVEHATQALGGLDLLVNNAGVFTTAPIEDMTAAAWDATFAVNTRGPWLVSRACLPHLRASRGGRIVHIGSLGAGKAWATHAAYCASKAALHSLTQTMARAWAPEVSVNAVAPGMVVTGERNQAYEEFARRTPMQRNASVEEVAAAVLFFATGPHFITGQVLGVDGGLALV